MNLWTGQNYSVIIGKLSNNWFDDKIINKYKTRI